MRRSGEPAAPAALPHTRGRGFGRTQALWGYRGFVLGMVVRDFRGRYFGSVLGASWAIINPLAQILIFTVVFSQVMRARLTGVSDDLAYGLFLCAGLLPWGYLVEVLTRSQLVFLEHGNLLKKMSFPRVTLPVYVFLSATLNFAIDMGAIPGLPARQRSLAGLGPAGNGASLDHSAGLCPLPRGLLGGHQRFLS